MYAKVFTSMYDGTLVTRGPWEALVTFQQLLILADKEGDVDKTPEVISRITTIPLDIIQKGIKALMEPDPYSRSPLEDGRRIVPINPSRPWGWKIVNYKEYRDMRSADERRAYMRKYHQEYRKQNKQNKHSVNTANNLHTVNPSYSDSEAFSEADSKKNPPIPPFKKGSRKHKNSKYPSKAEIEEEEIRIAEELFDVMNQRAGMNFKAKHPNGDPTAHVKFVAFLLRKGYTKEQMRKVAIVQHAVWSERRDGHEFVQDYYRPETLFNETKFMGYVAKLPESSTIQPQQEIQ